VFVESHSVIDMTEAEQVFESSCERSELIDATNPTVE
jgi:hypothetical protein